MKQLLSIIIATILVGCGGGGSGVHPNVASTVAIFGDSITAGIYCNVWPACDGDRLQPTPVMVIANRLGVPTIVHDLSTGGETTAMVISGVGIYRGASIQLKHPSLASWIESTTDQTVALRIGGADVVLGVDPSGTIKNISTIVERLQAANKQVVLVGVTGVIDRWRGSVSGIHERAATVNQGIADLAAARNIPFVDVRKIQFDETDLVDGLHPGRRYSDLQSLLIADTIDKVLKNY